MEEQPSFLSRFVDRYSRAISPRSEYKLYVDNRVQASSSSGFRNSRAALIDDLIDQSPSRITYSHALLSEQIVNLALQPLVCRYGYCAELSPQSLEHGNGQKGVDLLILDRRHKIMLGVDVKLGATSPELLHNGGGWLDNLKSPYVNLTLGNWQVKAKDPQIVNVKDWLSHSVIENISRSGQIPQLSEFRQFVCLRLHASLVNLLNRTEHPYHGIPDDDIPTNRVDYHVFINKLNKTIELFQRLCPC